MRFDDPLTSADAFLGDAIERAVMWKHHRRLSRHGALHSLDPGPGRWAQGEPPPRAGCEFEVLIDGADAFTSIADAIRNAKRTIWVTAWHIAPGFQLVRGTGNESVGALLAAAAERLDVRVLVWAGAPVPLFHPTRGEVEQAVAELTRSTRIPAARIRVSTRFTATTKRP